MTNRQPIVLKISNTYIIFKQLVNFIFILGLFYIIYLDKDPIYNYISMAAAVLIFLISIYNVIYFKTYRMEINHERICITFGVFSRTINYIELYRVKDYNFFQSLIMRILNVMELTFHTSDRTYPIYSITGVEKSNVLDDIRDLVEEQRRIKGVREFD